jgi:hypothetical protein
MLRMEIQKKVRTAIVNIIAVLSPRKFTREPVASIPIKKQAAAAM